MLPKGKLFFTMSLPHGTASSCQFYCVSFHSRCTVFFLKLSVMQVFFKVFTFFFKIFIYFIYLFFAASSLSCGTRGLHCGAGLLSSCDMRVFSLVVVRGLQGPWALQLWCQGSRAHGHCSLQHAGFLIEARELSSCGSQAQLPCDMWDLSSPTRDRTCVTCVGRQILCHWTTREVPRYIVFSCKLYDHNIVWQFNRLIALFIHCILNQMS